MSLLSLSSLTGSPSPSGERKSPETRPIYRGVTAEMMTHMMGIVDRAVGRNVEQIRRFYEIEDDTPTVSAEATVQSATEITGATAVQAAQTAPVQAPETVRPAPQPYVEQTPPRTQPQAPNLAAVPSTQRAGFDRAALVAQARADMAQAYGPNPLWEGTIAGVDDGLKDAA